MTFDDEFQARLDQLDNILGPLQDTTTERGHLDAIRLHHANAHRNLAEARTLLNRLKQQTEEP